MNRPTMSMNVPKFSVKDFLTFPVILVAGMGAIGTLLDPWRGRHEGPDVKQYQEALARTDSSLAALKAELAAIHLQLREEAFIKEAQLRGECLENDLEMLARQGLLNACQERNLLIGRAITPAVQAAASAAAPLPVPDSIP